MKFTLAEAAVGKKLRKIAVEAGPADAYVQTRLVEMEHCAH
jgi:hypothetical protein